MDKSTEIVIVSPQFVHYEADEIEVEAGSSNELHDVSNTAAEEEEHQHHHHHQKEEEQQQEDERTTGVKRSLAMMTMDLSPHDKDKTTRTREDFKKMKYEEEQQVQEDERDTLLFEPLDYERDWSHELQLTFFNFITSKLLDFDNDCSSCASYRQWEEEEENRFMKTH